MPTTNFSFPGVTLEQIFENRVTGTNATLGTVCIGQAYRIHSRKDGSASSAIDTSEWTLAAAFTAPLPGRALIPAAYPIDTADTYQKLYVVDGVWKYTTTGITSGTLTIADGLNKIAFNKIIKSSEGHDLDDAFNGRNVQVGDKIALTYTSTGETPATTNAIANIVAILESVPETSGYDTIVVDELPEDAVTDATLGTEFALVADESYDKKSGKFSITGANTSDEELSIVTTLTKDLAKIFGSEEEITGTLIAVPEVYFDYREKNPSLANTMNSAATPSEAVAILGPAVPENPLSMAVQFAILAAGGINVYFVGVRTDDKDGYLEAFDYLNSFNYVYNVVPATSDAAIIKALAGVVYSVSTNIDSKVRRTLWYGINTPNPVILAVDDATISDATTGKKKVVFDSNVFVTSPFQIGDCVSITDTVNGVKVTKLYEIVDTNFVNTAIVKNTDNELGNGAKENVGLARTQPTAAQLVDAIIAERVTNDFRSQCVWADDAMYDGNVVENYCLAAAAAGMRSLEQPWRPLSNLTYSFFGVAESHGFTKSQLERLGANGIWIVGNNDNGVPINKKAITTAMSNNINTESESIVANADEIALVLCHVGDDLVGSSNISPSLIVLLHDSIDSILSARCVNGTSAYVGSQLLSYVITNIYQDPVNLDEVYADVECEPPKPFNKFHITMRIV